MKVNLVVASGVHQGRAIAVTGPRFLIGRDPECHLRPASQAVSKKHCEVIIRDGKVFLKDYGSTNGTLHNEQVLQGGEREMANNDRIKVGPLDFIVRVEVAAKADAPTPMPAEAAAALAAVTAVSAAAPKPSAGARTPGANTPAPKAPKPEAATESMAALGTDTPGDDHDRVAAMLLGLGEDDEVPGGSTVMEMNMPTVDPNAPAAKPEEAKKGLYRPAATNANPSQDSVNAAGDLLKKMLKRTK